MNTKTTFIKSILIQTLNQKSSCIFILVNIKFVTKLTEVEAVSSLIMGLILDYFHFQPQY